MYHLEEIIDYVSNVSMAKIMAINLLDRNQEYAYRLLGRFQIDLGKTEIKIYAQKLEKKYATRICKSWISQSVNRSHVYYDDALEILKVLNGIMDEQEFRIYVHDFMKANKG